MSNVQSQHSSSFGSFRLDTVNECLWQEKQAIALKPKAFAVLRYLVEHPGRLVSKTELLDAVWADVAVSEGVLKFCIREVRKALGDNAQAPQFIETLHRRGYRFLPAVTTAPAQRGAWSMKREESPSVPAALRSAPSAVRLVGREGELAQLHHWLDKALSGERQMVFVTGEPGIGKTTLVDAFLGGIGHWELGSGSSPPPIAKSQIPNPGPWIARGQCIAHYGASEAYLPVLSALGHLCREPDGQQLIELLTQHAPTWLVQIPTLLNVTTLEALQRKTQGATQERMLREFAEAVEALTIEKPLVLVLEDVHWSDVSTLDLLSFLAQRRHPARLLVIGTYRPVEVLTWEHPLHLVKQELQLHGQCQELPLGLLTESAVEEYLAVRFPGGVPRTVLIQEFARVVHQRTEGNPLFIVNLVDFLLAQRALVQRDGQWVLLGEGETIEAGVPQSLQQMIEKQLDRLSLEEQRLLEAASIAGVEFSAVVVAAALGIEVEQIEEWCEGLARRQLFLRPTRSGMWPDGTPAAHYGFLHALYQHVLYERVTMTRRQRLHQRIGEREEAGYGEQAREIAAELALHFERSRDYKRAVKYFGQAGEKASGRSAHREAIGHLTKALELLSTLPDTPERTQQEIRLQITLGPVLMGTRGFAAPEVAQAYARARELCQQMRDTPQFFPVLVGLFRFYLVRAELQTAHELGKQCLSLARRVRDPALLLEAHMALTPPLLIRGELASAREHAERGIALYDPRQHRSHAFLYGLDPGMLCLSCAAWALWLLGYPDQALKRSHEALTLARELSYPLSLAFALWVAALLRRLRREGQEAKEQAETLRALSSEQGLPQWLAWGTIVRGWALIEQGQEEEGIAQIQQGIAAYGATGAAIARPYQLALLTEAYGKGWQVAAGLNALAEALAVVERTGERWYEAELYRLKGTLTLQKFRVSSFKVNKVQGSKSSKTNSQILNPKSQEEAEACFLKAIHIARKQQAKSLELRATMSLVRLRQHQAPQDSSRTTHHETHARLDEAHQMLSEIYSWFTEGFDTKDLQEAKVLLQELQSQSCA